MTKIQEGTSPSVIPEHNKIAPSKASNSKYPLLGRVSLIGASLIASCEKIGRAILNCFAFIGNLFTSCLDLIRSPKKLVNQPQPAETIFYLEPKDILTGDMREHRIRTGSDKIEKKLRKQFDLAQVQADQEADKKFRYLTAPENLEWLSGKEKAQIESECVSGMEVGVCHFIGRRRTMEDQHLTASFNLTLGEKIYPIQLFGIFDGHDGDEAALYVKANLVSHLEKTLLIQLSSENLSDEEIWNALKITFVKLSDEFKEPHSGTTATLAMFLDGRLWTANVGDSRTILDNGTQLSLDAKPSDPYFQNGIKNRGGWIADDRGIARVSAMISVARAVGDHSVPGMSARAKITVIPVPKDGSQLILTCDGIYDVSSTRQIASAGKQNKDLSADELAKNIVYSAFEAGSRDNLSAMVIKIPKDPSPVKPVTIPKASTFPIKHFTEERTPIEHLFSAIFGYSSPYLPKD